MKEPMWLSQPAWAGIIRAMATLRTAEIGMPNRFDICMARLDTGGADGPASSNHAAKPARKRKADKDVPPGAKGRDMADKEFREGGSKRQDS